MVEKDKLFEELVAGWFEYKEKEKAFSQCPREETLHDYLRGALEPAMRDDVERHLLQCDTCVQTLVSVLACIDDMQMPGPAETPAFIHKKVRRLLAAGRKREMDGAWLAIKKKGAGFVNALRDLVSFKNREYVYVRGTKKIISKNLVVLEKVFKDVRLEIEIEKIPSHAADIKVVASRPQTGTLLKGVRITLCDDSREVASLVASAGEVFFEHITFGNYRLTAWDGRKKIGEILLTIKE